MEFHQVKTSGSYNFAVSWFDNSSLYKEFLPWLQDLLVSVALFQCGVLTPFKIQNYLLNVSNSSLTLQPKKTQTFIHQTNHHHQQEPTSLFWPPFNNHSIPLQKPISLTHDHPAQYSSFGEFLLDACWTGVDKCSTLVPVFHQEHLPPVPSDE